MKLIKITAIVVVITLALLALIERMASLTHLGARTMYMAESLWSEFMELETLRARADAVW